MNNNNVPNSERNLCVMNTPYGLFLYFLICGFNEDDIFVFTKKIPEEIRRNIDHIYFPVVGIPLKIQKGNMIRRLFFYFYTLFEVLKLRFKLYFKTKNYELNVYGHGQLMCAFPLYENENSYIIEDGTGNYVELRPYEEFTFPKKIVLEKLFGKYIDKEVDGWGTHPNIKKVFLTREGYSPLIKDKVVVKNIDDMISALDEKDKEKILDIFNCKNLFNDNILSDASLLLTEAYFESELLSCEEEVNIYRKMISGRDNVIIKPHPRDKKDYNALFPNSKVIPNYFPMEIFKLLDINIKRLLVVESTTIFNFDCDVEFFEGEISSEFINNCRKRVKKQYMELNNNLD